MMKYSGQEATKPCLDRKYENLVSALRLIGIVPDVCRSQITAAIAPRARFREITYLGNDNTLK